MTSELSSKTTTRSSNVTKLKKMLDASWTNYSVGQLAQLTIPESLFPNLIAAWEQFFVRECDEVKLSIDLSRVRFSEISFKAFVHALANNKTLSFLSLRNISDNEASVLAHALKTNDSLIQLNLSSNTIGDEGTSSLATALTDNKTLRWLDLSSNNISCSGAEALASMRSSNDTIAYINLKHNPIHDEGQKVLANMALSHLSDCCIWISQGSQSLRIPFAI